MPMQPINTNEFHISIFGGITATDAEVELLQVMLHLPQTLRVKGSYANKPHVFQTSMLVGMDPLLPSLMEAKLMMGADWFRTTSEGTRFHIAL